MIGWGYIFQVPGLGGQVSGAGVQVRVQVQEFFPYPNLALKT
jgi:hypothetical protein